MKKNMIISSIIFIVSLIAVYLFVIKVPHVDIGQRFVIEMSEFLNTEGYYTEGYKNIKNKLNELDSNLNENNAIESEFISQANSDLNRILEEIIMYKNLALNNDLDTNTLNLIQTSESFIKQINNVLNEISTPVNTNTLNINLLKDKISKLEEKELLLKSNLNNFVNKNNYIK